MFSSFGDIHRFMGWQGAVLTDSGGYQIFSLPGERSISPRGAQFRLPSGRKHLLTPESSIAMQQAIGSDIMMVLDRLRRIQLRRTPHAREAMATTHALGRAQPRARTRGSCAGKRYSESSKAAVTCRPARTERARDHRAGLLRRLRHRRPSRRRNAH